MAAPSTLTPPGIPTLMGRALRLRCPKCGEGRLYAGWFTMHETCPVCGFRFEREPGYFVGAIYVNFALTVLFGIAPVVAADVIWGLSIERQLAIAVPLMIVFPIVCFRWSRSLWLVIDYFVTAHDDRAMRRRARRPPD
jgi:uncharacterized protein (DUF983 family)